MPNIQKTTRPPPQRPPVKNAVTQENFTDKAAEQLPPPSRFVFKPEVLDRVGVSYVSIWQWMRTGAFPASREVGGKVAWLESEIDEWMATRPLRKYKNAEAM
jgi:prophage regulatory protein